MLSQHLWHKHTHQKMHLWNDPFALLSLPTSPLTLRNATAHNGRHHQLRRTPLQFGAPKYWGIRGSESKRVGSEFDGEVQADVTGEASDLEVAVHHDSSGAQSDVVSGIPGSSFQHEGECVNVLIWSLLVSVKNENKMACVMRENFHFSKGFVFSERKWIRRRKGKCLSEFIGGMLLLLSSFWSKVVFFPFFLKKNWPM